MLSDLGRAVEQVGNLPGIAGVCSECLAAAGRPVCCTTIIMLLFYRIDCFRHLLILPPQTKPRILICTPSNAACDELLTRVMTDGFCDGSGALGCGAGALHCCGCS